MNQQGRCNIGTFMISVVFEGHSRASQSAIEGLVFIGVQSIAYSCVPVRSGPAGPGEHARAQTRLKKFRTVCDELCHDTLKLIGPCQLLRPNSLFRSVNVQTPGGS